MSKGLTSCACQWENEPCTYTGLYVSTKNEVLTGRAAHYTDVQQSETPTRTTSSHTFLELSEILNVSEAVDEEVETY
jgi:hypothetical protein